MMMSISLATLLEIWFIWCRQFNLLSIMTHGNLEGVRKYHVIVLIAFKDNLLVSIFSRKSQKSPQICQQQADKFMSDVIYFVHFASSLYQKPFLYSNFPPKYLKPQLDRVFQKVGEQQDTLRDIFSEQLHRDISHKSLHTVGFGLTGKTGFSTLRPSDAYMRR